MTRIVILGATGNIGQQVLEHIADLGIKYDKIIPLCGKNSDGKSVALGQERVKAFYDPNFIFNSDDIVISCVRAVLMETMKDKIINAGAKLIDTSSYFRKDKDIPLIVPEVNGEKLDKANKIIASPNCVAAPLTVVLKPLHDKYKIKRIVISTYQAVSGAGVQAMEELYIQTKKMFESAIVDPLHFEKQIAFNCIPKIGDIDGSGVSGEEEKVVSEIKKILDDEDIEISATCVRVPAFKCHGCSVNIQFNEDFNLSDLKNEINSMALVKIPEDEDFITQTEAAATNEIYVSRIRRDSSTKNSLNFWLVSDNIRKGGALNAVQILQALIEKQ